MEAHQANLLKFLKKSPQFSIPIYQRPYSWIKDQCVQLWEDMLRVGRDNKVDTHFIGSIVYVEQGLGTVTQQEPLLVIDGQQRLTTSTLLIAALADYFETQGIGELLEAFSAKKLRNYYLLNPEEDGERHFKLILSETDKETLLAILQDLPLPVDNSTRISENYQLFKELISNNQDELKIICQGLAKLVIVDVALDRSQDNPQLIFESLNSTGMALKPADLIRNYILMGLESKLQTNLYKTYWRPMEKGFGQNAYVEHFDPFMRHYLIAKTGNIPNIKDVYVVFKQYANLENTDIHSLVADIHTYAEYYRAMVLGTEPNLGLKLAFHDLRELKVDVAYPFLLDAYHHYKQDKLKVDELLQIVRMVESYVFRRAICAIPTNSLNKIFAALSSSLKEDCYLESVKAAFLLLPSYRRFPNDEEFQREIKKRDLYNFRSRSYWLRRLENHAHKEYVIVTNYTVEHILPQKQPLSKEWQTELGSDWQRIQHDYLHTLGNLTLTGYNSEYSDNSFEFKQNATDKNNYLVGFKGSPLKLNTLDFQLNVINEQTGEAEKQTFSLATVPQWNEQAIQARADRLALEATKVWVEPQLAPDVLNKYRPSVTQSGQQYTIADYPHLASGTMRDLFEALRKAVVSLDPCINEEFLKIYIAYKAETNFVDVIPQAKRLLLVLNLKVENIEDPKSLCRDISNIGHSGNGDVEVAISTLDELPYVMGLISQSFEQQMGDASDS